MFFLIYLTNPFNPQGPKRFFLRRKNESLREIAFKELVQSKETIVSYHLENLFLVMSSNGYLCRGLDLIDVCQAYKLLYGRPFKGKMGDEPWNIWCLIRKQKDDLKYIKEIRECIYGIKTLQEKELLKRIDIFFSLLEQLWQQAIKQLKKTDEYDRYIKLEKPVNEMLLEKHLDGIKISQQRLRGRLDVLDKKISTTSRSLKEEYGIRDLSNPGEIVSVLHKYGVEVLSDQKKHLEDTLDFYAEQLRLPRLLKLYRDSKRDKDILLRLGGINAARIHPVYKCFGTVTGRILIESPSLQNLKRENRDIIEPDVGKIFLYPDYSQFEPGIMASEAQDKILINDFNNGDLYVSLSVKLFGDLKCRRLAKLLFLAFCYGMTMERMAQILIHSNSESLGEKEKVIRNFFGRYQRLIKWKTSIESELLRNKKIGTVLGNYRYRDCRGKQLSYFEKRWVISQRIQGTASVILKEVILRIKRELTDVDILIPMHDALLVQVPIDKAQRLQGDIEQIFKNEFIKVCPVIKPRISFSPFVENKESEKL